MIANLLYHVLLWIRNAPVVGQDEPEEILAWLHARITCHIPDVKSDPDLYRLVTRYQMQNVMHIANEDGDVVVPSLHGVGLASLTKPEKNATLHCVEEALKSHNRIYELP